MRRDGQADCLALIQSIALVQASAADDYVVVGAEIDTKGLDVAAIIVEPSRAIAAGDDIRLVVQDSDTSGGTFTDIDVEKKLPTYKQDGGMKVYEPTSPYAQVFGFIGTERYVKIGFNGKAIDTSNVTLDLTITFKPLDRPAYVKVDPAAPSDSLP